MNSEVDRARLSISLADLRQAGRFVSFILRRKLHTKSQTDYVKLLHLAFHTSMVISYSRPFGANRGLHKGKASLKSLVDRVLTPDEIALHEKILDLRNTAYGHSDASSHLLPQFDYTKPGFKLMKDPFIPLNHDQTRQLNAIIGKWLRFLDAQRNDS